LTVALTYNGSPTDPTAARSYTVIGTINDPNYTGSATGTLVISKATATVTLGSLAQTFTGSPLSATAVTTPAGLTVAFTYNGSPTAPSAAGSYTVTGTINDPNYTGSATRTLIISKATATVTLGSLMATYTGTSRAATAITAPAGLTVNLAYNGSPTAPIAAGSYAVVATINDTDYQGSATGTLVISKASASVTLSNLMQTYTGSPLAVTATTSPSGLTIGLTYNGSITPPTAVGSYTVVATINDLNYRGSATGTLVIGNAPPPATFIFNVSGPQAETVIPGNSVSYRFSLAPTASSYPGVVAFAVSALPAGATATFSPATIAADSGAQIVTMMVQTSSPPARNDSSNGRRLPLAALLLPLVFIRRLRKSGRNLSILCLMLLSLGGIAATSLLTGCGTTTGSSLQAPKDYFLTVTATSGDMQRKAAITLDVQ
jgi:hypothetical protein